MDVSTARKAYKKMTNQTQYFDKYGEPPKAEEDYVVMKHKKMTDLDISRFLKPEVVAFLENWKKFRD